MALFRFCTQNPKGLVMNPISPSGFPQTPRENTQRAAYFPHTDFLQ